MKTRADAQKSAMSTGQQLSTCRLMRSLVQEEHRKVYGLESKLAFLNHNDRLLPDVRLRQTCSGCSGAVHANMDKQLSRMTNHIQPLPGCHQQCPQVRGLSVLNPYHGKLERSSVDSAFQNVHWPPAVLSLKQASVVCTYSSHTV